MIAKQKYIRHASVLLLAQIAFWTSTALQADSLLGVSVENLVVESSVRSGRATFDYTFSVSVANEGTGASSVSANVTSSSNAIQILDENVTFEYLAADSTAFASSSLVLRVDRRVAFDPAVLAWTFDGEPDAVLGSVSGSVVGFLTGLSVGQGALVNLQFPNSESSFSTTTDSEGNFLFDSLSPDGSFVIDVTVDDGFGTAEGFILPGDLDASVVVEINPFGAGTISGIVSDGFEISVEGAIVTALFPETSREYSTTTDLNGSYTLVGLAFDGTVIITAFDSSTGASASSSEIINSGSPSAVVNFVLDEGTEPNPELLNTGFNDGLENWTIKGVVQVVDRSSVFDLEDAQ